MNLKNSKFGKRIQMLRRISKEKFRKEKERNRIDWDLENAFRERGGVSTKVDVKADDHNILKTKNHHQDDDYNYVKTQLKMQQQNFIMQQCANLPALCSRDSKLNTLISLDNSHYEVNCCTRSNKNKNHNDSMDSMPSISSTRGSICVCHSRYALIGRIGKLLGFKVVKESKLWNILWTDSLPGVEIYKNMKRFQQINHFPGMMEICRKDLLSRNLNRMQKLYPKDYKIFPKTWVFPADYGDALKYASYHNKPKTFIIKPDSGAQGRGIWLTNDLKNVSTTERMICQTYIGKPLLIDGYKFDLRVYALITSVDPLRIFVYNEGLARFATNKYVEPSTDNNADLYMHLTNYSVNKRNSQYELCDDDDCGSKRKFNAINNWMRCRNLDVDQFWEKIDDIIIKTVLSAWPVLKHNYHACFSGHDKIQACFEILGFDILVDSKMKPYILEVNHSPSFHTNELVDRQVKRALIKDTLSLVSTALADKRHIMREDRKRVKQRLLKVKSGNLSHRSNISSLGPMPNKNPINLSSECPLSAMAQQIAWEESHLGDFRRIMPPNEPTKLNYYCQFYGQQNQASIFADTAASKKREEVSKRLRKELEERKQKQTDILKRHGGAVKFEERQKKRAGIPREIVEKSRQTLMRSQAHWTPGFISAAEERLRSTYMQMRTDMLKDLKVMETIYTNLYKHGNLSNTDIVKFPQLYRNLEGGGRAD